jgi:TRAP transporter 4TM/12TM fusion protein
MQAITRYTIQAAAFALAGFHLYTGFAGTFQPYVQRSIPVLLSIVLALLMFPGRGGGTAENDRKVSVTDWILVLLAIPAIGYVAFAQEYLTTRWPMTDSYAPRGHEIVFGVVTIILLLETTRRVLGYTLVIGSIVALVYCYLGDKIGWSLLSHRGFSAIQILDQMYLTLEGVWGSVLGVATSYIALFIIFGAFAERAGVANFIIELCTGITGHTKGGPAKVAVIASGMTGSVTGSTVANVYTTGQFTIPMMKRLGYRPPMAGAVEALASNGGQMMPPVLGAAAFMIAVNTGLSYSYIALVSIMPAMIYYLGLFLSIHLSAAKEGLVGIPKSERPSPWKVFRRGGHLLLPLVVLIGLFVYGYSPIRAAFFSIVFTVVISWFRKDTRMGPRAIFEAMVAGGKGAVLIILTCAIVGFIVGAFILTGSALNISSAIIFLSGGNFVVLLFTVGLACIILGMGMNTVAAFVLVSVVAVPALTMQGVNDLVANMFVFYFALLSHITPPVCLAIFAAAAIAQTSPWQTAWEGIKLGFISYLLPFLIVIAPPLLLIGTPWLIAKAIITSLAGAGILVTAVQGWMFARTSLAERTLATVSGALLLWVNPWLELLGAILAIALMAYSWKQARSSEATQRRHDRTQLGSHARW